MKAQMVFGIFMVGTIWVFMLSPTMGESPSFTGPLTDLCRPENLGTTPKSPGDNGYRIHISGSPNHYKPGELYQVTLKGTRTQFHFRKFIGFMLTVEAKEEENYISPRPDAGSFNLLGDSLSKFSERCPNAVVEVSHVPKSEVEVTWRAPSLGVGCVVFRAAVQENSERLFMDEGNLVLELCEKGQNNPDEEEQRTGGCCACGRAEYELSFKGLWSKETHPKDFPANEYLTHFSDIIGASHTQDYRMWQDQGYASVGVKDVAEKGATRKLELDLRAKSSEIHSIFKARGLWYPDVNGVTSAEFSVDDQHHLVSLLTMLSPSSDWIVGVDSLDLCLKNCSWIAEKTVELPLWDAGTSNGVTYLSRRQPTVPQEKIRRITSSHPNNPLSPFYDPSGAPVKPFGHLTLRRQQVHEEPCVEPGQVSSRSDSGSEDSEITTDCPVSEWGEFSPCSATCGDGFHMRSRQYLDPNKANMNACSVSLLDKQPCQEICVGNVSCKTTEWDEWSECSVTCGKGFRTRSRRFLEYRARKICSVEVTQKDPCMGMKAECENPETVDPLCAVTPWSTWSPCTVTCGEGVKIRTRLYFNPTSVSVCNVELMQQAPCTGPKASCVMETAEAKEICMLPKEVGPCRGYFPRWHFDVNKLTCVQFVYGGCRGNRNNFGLIRECLRTCQVVLTGLLDEETSTATNVDVEKQENPAVDCMVTPWSEWSPCSHTCGSGRKERRRMVKVNPENGGQPCPEKLVQRRRCKGIPICPSADETPRDVEYPGNSAVDCMVTPWSQWTPCSHTCGSGQTERHRMIKVNPENGGKPCPEKLAQRRKCSNIPTCSEIGAEDGGTDVDCILSEWSEWAPCSKTCGDYAFMERIRMVTQHPRNNGAPCGHRVERKYCRLLPCPS